MKCLLSEDYGIEQICVDKCPFCQIHFVESDSKFSDNYYFTCRLKGVEVSPVFYESN